MPTEHDKRTGCLTFFFPWLNGKEVSTTILEPDSEVESYPYCVSDRFLSPAEHSFYLVAQKVLGANYMIAPKVSLAEIFFITDREHSGSYLNRIIKKRVDFLVCDAIEMKPRFAIELDDSSHSQERRIKRDDFVNKVFLAAKLPLVRIITKNTYSTKDLYGLFMQALGLPDSNLVNASIPKIVQQTTISQTDLQPKTCPRCGAPMIIRIAQSGPHVGQRFLGCKNFPNCRTLIPIPKEENN